MYLAAVAVTILGIYAVAELGISVGVPAESGGDPRGGYESTGLHFQFHPWLLGVVALANLLVIGGASLFKIAELRSGGRVCRRLLTCRRSHRGQSRHTKQAQPRRTARRDRP